MTGRWLSVKSMGLSGKRAQLTLQTPDGWVFTHEERHHLLSSQVADWQLSLWWGGERGEGRGGDRFCAYLSQSGSCPATGPPVG